MGVGCYGDPRSLDWDLFSPINLNCPGFSVMLGSLLIIFGVLSLSGIDLQVPEGQENYWGILVGIVGGLMLGMTGISVPSVFYLYGLKLTRDELVQALGIVLNIVTVFLAIALCRMGMLYEKQLLLSIGALFGTVCGMVIGQQIRRHIPEGLFRKFFLSFLMILDTYIITDALMNWDSHHIKQRVIPK